MFALAKSNGETVADHTRRLIGFIDDLREVYKDFLTYIDWDILEYAAKYHDVGKINPHFQYKMHKLSGVSFVDRFKIKGEEYPHNYLSGAFLDYKEIIELFGIEGYVIILNAIHYHHCREMPYKSEIKKYVCEILRDFISSNEIEDLKELNIKPVLNVEYLDEYRDWNSDDKRFPTDRYIKIKGLLHRLDYCASAYIDDIEKPSKDSSGKYLQQKIMEMYSPNDVQKYMLENRDNNLIVEASTGIGKTEAALLWIGSSKGFYTLPLQVSINAIYDRIVSKKYFYERVGLLHANALSELITRRKADEENIEETIIKHQDARLLSMPLTICTVDQLFNFVYKYNGYEMLLTTLANSKVVIDEIQSYSPQNIGLLIAGLKMITELGGKFAIVTATFPKVIYELFDKYKIQVDKPEKSFHNPELPQRHKIKVMGDEFDYEKIKALGMNKKVLVICNTVKSAINTYDRLIKDDANVKGLLHSRYIRKHRALIEAELLKFAENNPDKRPEGFGIWVTTQIVEASLDVDFDVLISEACSIDSLLQRMGRVYRSRLFTGDEYNVYVVNNRNGVGKGDRAVIDEEIYERSVEAIFAYDGQILTESDSRDKKQEMMDMVYNDSSLGYVQKIEQNLNKVLKLTPYMLEKQHFRDIHNITVIPICFKDKVDKLVDQIKNSTGVDKFKLLDEMQSYTLGINFYNRAYTENLAENVYRNIKYINNAYEFNERQYLEKGIFSGAGLTDKIKINSQKENLDTSGGNMKGKGLKKNNML
jgi:CRISPR-associated endonuclease/helicase Cas3